jgi:hypothetical protein
VAQYSATHDLTPSGGLEDQHPTNLSLWLTPSDVSALISGYEKDSQDAEAKLSDTRSA